MNFNHLLSFAEVVRVQSISTAAQNLHISQPALSKTIKILEKEIGHPLLVRTNKGVHPTALGQKVCDDFSTINKLVQSWKTSQTTFDLQGIVHVGCIQSGSSYLMNNIILPFSKEYPNIEVILHAINVQNNFIQTLSKNSNSIIISSIPPTFDTNYLQHIKKNGWNMFKIFTDERKILIGASHPLAQKAQLSIADLKKLSIAYYYQGQDPISSIYESYFHSSYKLSSRETIMELVIANEVVFMPVYHLMKSDHYIKNGLVKAFDVPIANFKSQVPIIALLKDKLEKHEYIFAEYLLDHFAVNLGSSEEALLL